MAKREARENGMGEKEGEIWKKKKSESEKSARARWWRGDEELGERKTGERRGLEIERIQKKASLEDTLV